jgi:hypothetical protein
MVDEMKVEQTTTGRIKGKQQTRTLYIIACVLLLLAIVCSAFSWIAYRSLSISYHRDTALVREGVQHLKAAMTLLESLPRNPLDAISVQGARREFTAALPIFSKLEADLTPLPAVSSDLPIYGGRLGAALHLVPAALQFSQAGIVGCDMLELLIARLHNPLQVQTTQGLTAADLATIGQDVQRIQTAFNLAAADAAQVSPADVQFDSRIATLLATFQQQLPTLRAVFDEVDKLLPVLPTLLGVGTPANYLIEVLDSTELRPAGGFLGNYGIATLSGARLTSAHITDVDLLDQPYAAAGHIIPFPPAYSWFNLVPSWSLRDSDLDADFPTSARYGEQNYLLEGGTVPVQGVIALTPALIEHALTITGPIAVPEYQETVTSQNLIARIHFHQLGGPGANGGSDQIPSPDGHSSLRKRFTELLAEHFLARVRQLSPSDLAKFLQLLVTSVRTKDIQIYLNSSVAEQLLQRFHLDSSIQAPASDSLFVVDANISANKANSFIGTTLNDQVTIDNKGNALHHTTLTYTWTTPGEVYGPSIYTDYVRVYVPPGSHLQTQRGWQPKGTSNAFGREVWAGLFKLPFGQTNTITLTWTVPDAATQQARTWHYRYLIQRQAGIEWLLHLHIDLPSCAVTTATQGGLHASAPRAATLSQSINEDMTIGLDYTCS